MGNGEILDFTFFQEGYYAKISDHFPIIFHGYPRSGILTIAVPTGISLRIPSRCAVTP